MVKLYSIRTMTLDRATSIAQKWIDRQPDQPEHNFILLKDKTQGYAFGWVFFMDTKRHMDTENVNDLVPGTAPLIVNRDGDLILAGSSVSPDLAINIYLKQWQAAHH